METKWFDLNRFGASLKVLPITPLRRTALTVLEVHDWPKLLSSFDWDGAGESFQKLKDFWVTRAREALGFSDFGAAYEMSAVADGNSFSSSRLKFSLRDIRLLVPGVTVEDLRLMHNHEISMLDRLDKEFPRAWEAFSDEVLVSEGRGVWVPKKNPFDTPWDDAQSLEVHGHSLVQRGIAHPLIKNGELGGSREIMRSLSRGFYRSNSLVAFYVDRESALADGWENGEIEQRDLNYALPLWVTQGGQVQALKDVRYVTQLMDADPVHYLGDLRHGVVSGALREITEIRRDIEQKILLWQTWDQSLTQELPEEFRSTLTAISGAHFELCKKYPTVFDPGFEAIEHNSEGHVDGMFEVMPLSQMEEQAVDWVVDLCSKYTFRSDVERGQLKAVLDRLMIRVRPVLELTSQKNSIDSPRASVEESKIRHEDAGEKIGGARKDFARRAMCVDDIEAMNDAERDLYVIKKNVWPPLNYAQMREDGVSAEAALGIKLVKDRLSSTPVRRRTWGLSSRDYDERYIEAISVVRDRFREVLTLDDFNKACKELFELGCCDENGQPTNTIYGTNLQVQWGRKVSDIFYGGSDGRTPRAVSMEIRRKVSVFGREPTESEAWRSMIKPKKEKTQEQLDEAKAKTALDKELHRPHLAHVERVGADWRVGRDISADDLIEKFGFRGVEFGNWLPQDERQVVLNMAFDSFCDLAQALSIPPESISLGGTLAIAFGSRGSGGKNAALAHYERARKVINLTRMNGAGCLAHEWAHAFDDYLGNGNGFASEQVSAQSSFMRKVAQRLSSRPATEKELLSKLESDAKRGMEYARSWYYGQPQDARHKIFDVLQSEYARVEAELYTKAIDSLKRSGAGEWLSSEGVVGYEGMVFANQVYEKLKGFCPSKTALSKVRGKVEGNLGFMTRNLGKLVTIRAAQDIGYVLPASFFGGGNAEPSDFIKEAKKLDSTRSSPYWATTVELFARAVASYVSDKLEVVGERSDYLVYGADEEQYVDHEVGNPNPTGQDRRELGDIFDALFTEYRMEFLSKMEDSCAFEP